jgi:hypothetical protein
VTRSRPTAPRDDPDGGQNQVSAVGGVGAWKPRVQEKAALDTRYINDVTLTF